MRTRSLPSSFAQLFGFLIVALMLIEGSCRLNRAKAQEPEDDGVVVKTHWCNREYYIQHYGDPAWHEYWAWHLCWLYTGEPEPVVIAPDIFTQPQPPKPVKQPKPRFVMRGNH